MLQNTSPSPPAMSKSPSQGLSATSSSAPWSSSNAFSSRSNAFSNKLTSVLSASYADLDIRDALETLDKRGIENTPETRRRFRLEVQKEVLDCNGEIIQEFAQVAEVSLSTFCAEKTC